MNNQEQIKFLNKRISTPVGVIIIVLCALLVGGILAWQYWWLPKAEVLKEKTPEVEVPKEKSLEAEAPEVKKPEEVTEDETVSWPIYKDNILGIKIKYPPNWLLREGVKTGDSLTLKFIPVREPKDVWFKISVSRFLLLPKGVNYVEDLIAGLKEEEGITIELEENTTLSGIPAYKLVLFDKEKPTTKTMTVMGMRENFLLYQLSYWAENNKYSEFIDKVNKMIATFEIISFPKFQP